MATKPSLALIPSGVKASKVYSVLPSDGTGDFDFTRSGEATRINKDGLIETVASNVPRLNYPLIDGVVSGCPSLLLENSSTNLVTYSEDFTDASWDNINGTPTSNVSISPSGNLSADSITWDNVNGFHLYYTNLNFTQIGKHVSGYFLKENTIDKVQIYTAGVAFAGSSVYANFDISNGVVGDYTTEDAGVINYGNGWYYCYVIETTTAIGTGVMSLSGIQDLSDGYRPQYTADGISNFFVWGAQTEEGSFPTSYIKSNGSATTRSVETCDGAGTTAEINSQEGVLYAEIRALANDGTNRVISLSDGSTSNRASVFYKSSNNTIRYQYIVGGSAQCGIEITLPSSLNYSKVAIYYKENDFKMYVNGLLVGSEPSGSVLGSGVLNELSFFAGGAALPFYGKVKDLRVYKEALSDLELATLTGFTSFAEMRSYLNYSAE
jgi:hypothetical protein